MGVRYVSLPVNSSSYPGKIVFQAYPIISPSDDRHRGYYEKSLSRMWKRNRIQEMPVLRPRDCTQLHANRMTDMLK